jgi:hypothetical protein
MMEKVLLGVSAMLSKMTRRKLAQLFYGHLPSAQKIFIAQGPFDPNVDRERSQPLEAEQHNAVGDLGADSGQSAKLGAQFIV